MEPISLVSQNIYKELSTAPVNWLLGNVGDKIRIESIVDVHTFALSSSDNPFIINAQDGYIGTNWLKGYDDCFKNFKIGDTINLYSQFDLTTQSFTIIDKLSDFEIRLNAAYSGAGVDHTTYVIVASVTTAITAIKYHYNFIENSSGDTFASIFDLSEQLLINQSKIASDTTVSAMLFTGPVTWRMGSATVQGVSVGAVDGVWTSRYKIIHYATIPPFLLYNQIDDQLAGIPYKDFKTTKCWKFISMFEAAEVYTDPNFLVSEIFSAELGNTGWYNENFNTGITNYSISNVAYTNATLPVASFQLDTSTTKITFDINNTTDSPFSNLNTKFVIGFFKIPADPSEYQASGVTLDKSFLYDRKLQTVGSALVNGDNYGTSYQVLKLIEATYVSASKISVTASCEMGADVLASLIASADPKYMLFIQVQNHTKATADPFNDLVTLVVDINTPTIITADPTMIVPTNTFIRHPEADPATEGITPDGIKYFMDVWPEDEIVACSDFYIEGAGRATDIIKLTSVNAKIFVSNSVTNEEFELDQFTMNLNSIPLTGYTQEFDLQVPRAFHIPVGTIRKYIEVKRRHDLDFGTRYYFSSYFPFLFRWEYWVQKIGAAAAFFNVAQPQNGQNHWWYHYATGDWTINYKLTVKATKNGAPQQYELIQNIIPHDYNSSPDYTARTITTQDAATLTPLTAGGLTYISGYQDTLVIADFTRSTIPPGTYNMVIGIEAYEAGGIYGKRRYSSKWVADSDTWFKSIDGSGKVIVTIAGGIITGKCLIDHTKLPTGITSFKLSARIYDSIVGDVLTTDDGVIISTDGGIDIIID